jgi:hypothetical protein
MNSISQLTYLVFIPYAKEPLPPPIGYIWLLAVNFSVVKKMFLIEAR